MSIIRRTILALTLIAGITPAIAQVPPPVPALPDTERRTSYSLTASTCVCSVGFALYGDSTDYQNWIEVWLNGVRVNYNDATYGWTVTSPSGSLSSLARPITDGVLTFNAVQTGTVQIVGARRPRRVSQYQEGGGVPTRNFNRDLTDIIAQNRELWDKTNDMTGRGIFAVPGETLFPLPAASSRATSVLGFDAFGQIKLYSPSNAASFPHLVVYTVASAGATLMDRLRADFVGDGANDQNAIASAITAAGVTNSKVVVLPGVYTFSAAVTISSANNFALDAHATVVFGAAGADAFVINGSSDSTFNFGTIITNGTGAAIHIEGSAAAVVNTFIGWGKLQGTSHQGNGLFFDVASGPMAVNRAFGGWIEGFNKGVVMDASGTTNYIDTTHVKSTFIFDCNTDIYGRSGTARKNNSNIWDVNIDPYINGAVGIDIDHSFDKFDVIWGDQAPNPATTLLLKLEAGALGNIFNGTPNLYQTFGASYVSDLSGNTSNSLNVQASQDAVANGAGQLVKLDPTTTGMLDRTGISLGTVGAVNTLSWFSSAGVWSSLPTANSSVLVTNGSGVPSWVTTLPSGLALPSPNIVGVTNGGNASAGSVGEYVSSIVAYTSPVSLATTTATNITSISLTAGDWDVFWTGGVVPASTTNVTRYFASISLVSNTSDTSYITDNMYPSGGIVNSVGAIPSSPVGMRRVSVNSTTTVYGIVQCNFTVSTCGGYGNLSARRIR